MSVAQLKEEIAALGGSVDGCYERGEVEEKLREVRQGGTVRWKAASETGVEGSAADQMPGGAGRRRRRRRRRRKERRRRRRISTHR